MRTNNISSVERIITTNQGLLRTPWETHPHNACGAGCFHAAHLPKCFHVTARGLLLDLKVGIRRKFAEPLSETAMKAVSLVFLDFCLSYSRGVEK